MVLFPSFLDGLARTLSPKKGSKLCNDIGKETAEALAKEAKKNELMLTSSCSGMVKSDQSSNLSSVCSKRGEKGINQDCLIVWEEFGCQKDMIFCGIFDGHGTWGHFVSKKVMASMPSSLLCNWQQSTLASMSTTTDLGFDMEKDRNLRQFCWCVLKQWQTQMLNGVKHGADNNISGTIKPGCAETYDAIDLELKQQSEIDSFRSGSTALTIVKQGENLIIANVGDSRAVLATTSENGSLVPLQLTVDFKPNLPQEADRIKRCKGRVFSLEDEPGVYRVWMPNKQTPGLAISRAFGDYCVKDFGLISVPGVTQRKITSRDHFVILATDGVWDVISNQEAVEIVSSAPDKEKSAKRLVQCAALAWRSKKRGIAMDDISVICLFFHSSPSKMVHPLVSQFSGFTKSN